MLRVLWKCVLEVLPPTCATVVAGLLLSAYHDHIAALQSIIDPRASLEEVANPTPEGSKQQQAIIAPQVQVESPAIPAESGGKSSAPAADTSSTTPAGEGDPVGGKTSETKPPEAPDTKAAQVALTDNQAAELNAVLMASSPMSQPPAEIKAPQPPETKAPESTAAGLESAPAEGQPAGPDASVEAAAATDVSPPPAQPAAAKPPDSQAVTPVLRPHYSRHVAKPARKMTGKMTGKMESERLPPPAIAMVPLPPPAGAPMVAMEAPTQVLPSRAALPSHVLPPQVPAAPQAIGPTPSQATAPPPPAAGVATGPTGAPSPPGGPQDGVNSSQEGAAKTSEPTRVFGVPIPPSIAAVGGALDPRPVFNAGQKAFEKIVITAKSVVPDFGHEP
jgi:hypothetical protein